jgi:translation initiation factor 2 gamma subunit (eIF-2gamma)
VAHGKSTVVKAISGVQLITNIDTIESSHACVCLFLLHVQ